MALSFPTLDIPSPSTVELLNEASPRNERRLPLARWAQLVEGVYMKADHTLESLPAGVYRARYSNQHGCLLILRVPVQFDDLYALDDAASHEVLRNIEIFWDSQSRYQQLGALQKRGILLWGAPGSGKSSTIALIIQDVVKRNGIVFFTEEADICADALQAIRGIEPHRPIVHIMEDVDTLMERKSDEHKLLAVLDGEQQIDNVVHIATTNYPELLDARVVQRPNRFDEVIQIGMPNARARRQYLERLLAKVEGGSIDLDAWVNDTDGLSLAHLRELTVSVVALGRPYDKTLTRLKGMLNGERKPSSAQERRRRNVGFGQ